MKLNVERLPESQVVLDITADEDEFAKAMDRAVRRVTREVRIPGFRPGKAPRSIVERMFGREIFLEEAHREIMDDLYKRALDQEELVPVGSPDVDIIEQEPINFRVQVAIYPTVDPGPYQDVRVEPQDATVDEAAVDEVVERLQRTQSPWVDPAEPRHPRAGDQVTIDLAVSENGEPFRGQEPSEDAVFVLGESNLLTALRERIEQMEVGETAKLDVSFAEDDLSVNPEIRGHRLVYTVTLKGLKERDLLPLDDEFAKTVADSESMEALRQEIRDDLHQGKTSEARNEVLTEIIRKMLAGATIELPPVMIDEAAQDEVNLLRQRLQGEGRSLEEYLRLQDQTEDELREELRPEAEQRLRRTLLLREIAKREGVEVSNEDVHEEIHRLIPAGAENASRLHELYHSDYFSQMLRNDLFERRLSDRLIELATEGQGAVINGWEPPEPAPASEAEAAAEGDTQNQSQFESADDDSEEAAAAAQAAAEDEGSATTTLAETVSPVEAPNISVPAAPDLEEDAAAHALEEEAANTNPAAGAVDAADAAANRAVES